MDWSRYGFIVITPVDGSPVYKPWVDLLKSADGTLSISEFGVRTHREAGIPSELCRPGIDPNAFFRHPDARRKELRQQTGIDPEAFVVGTTAMNQGRKSIPTMLSAFFRFAAGNANARYILDMDAQSPAGWDIPNLCEQFGWDASRLIFRADLVQRGLVDLRDRYNLMDAHMVISHREGWGLPLVEAMACGVVSIALDWCSGTEICGDGKGVLVKPLPYKSVSTWGGALDYHVDEDDLVAQLHRLYDNPDERRAIARRGMEWARTVSWDAAADSVQRVIERVMAKRQSIPPAHVPMLAQPPAAPTIPDGVVPESVVELIEHAR